jgi:hypothetical protein
MYHWTPFEWLYTLLSGPALLTLHDLYLCPGGSGWLAVVVLGVVAALSVGLSWAWPRSSTILGLSHTPRELWVDLCSLAVQLVANAALLLRKGTMMDPDVGSNLIVIPLVALMSMQWGAYQPYNTEAKLFMAALTLCVLVYTTVVVLAGKTVPDAYDTDTSFNWVFLATNALFGVTESCQPVLGVVAQVAGWVCLLFVPVFLEVLLVSVHPLPLFVFHGTLLVLVCVSLSARVNHTLCCLNVRHHKRVLLLFNACVLSTAYNFHWGHPGQIALAAILVLFLRGCCVALRKFESR